MQSRDTEIREILVGNYNSTGDKVRYEQNTTQMVWAMSMAILGTRIFGAVKQRRVYNCTGKSLKRVKVDCLKAFSDFGLLTELQSEPELLACFRRTWYTEPVILTAETNPETLQLTICAYTRFVFFSYLSLRSILRKIEKEIDGIGRVSGKELREENKALKKAKKEEKKALKEARKAEKKALKEAKQKEKEEKGGVK